ncbi:MAG: 7TM diverse intracellular signaling domain-containing protein [Cytophagaceae bacterium]
MNKFAHILFLVSVCAITFFSGYQSLAGDTLNVYGVKNEEYVLSGSYMEIFEDTSTLLTIEDILLKDELKKQFRVNDKPFPFNENTGSAYWIKIIIRNYSDFDRHFIFESFSLNTSNMQLYYADENGTIIKQETGEQILYSQRYHNHKNLVLNLPMPKKGETRVFYVRVYSNLFSSFDYHIKALGWFVSYSLTEYLLLGIYYGILLIMGLYNLIIFFTLKARVHLYYVFYIAAGIFASLNEDKLGFQYLWPDSPFLNPVFAYHVTPAFFLSAFILYAMEFLELKQRLRKFYVPVILSVALYFILFAINIFSPIGHTLRLFYLIPYLIVYSASLYSYFFIRGHRPAKLFVIGSTFVMVSVILIQLRSMGYMPGNIFTVYILNYSLIVESVVLSIALSERIKLIQKEREEAQQRAIEELEENKRLQTVVNQQLREKQILQEKVNLELEEKVRERTVELQKAYEEISRMNDLLFADNIKLEINLKELAKARVMLKGVDFEEFSKIYPDEEACYKFLSELKWKDGYKCKKCGHENYCDGQTSFSRRCTRCRYDESPTAYTIFQGIKFPINKAFYILFLHYSSKEKLTSTEISRILFLRQKTCWSFIHKIVDAGKSKSSSRSKGVTGWASLIMEV